MNAVEQAKAQEKFEALRGDEAWDAYKKSPAVRALVAEGFTLEDLGAGDWVLQKPHNMVTGVEDLVLNVAAFKLEGGEYVAPPWKMTGEEVVLSLMMSRGPSLLELRFRTVRQLLEALKGLQE